MAVKELSSPELCEHPNIELTPLVQMTRCADCGFTFSHEEVFEAFQEYRTMVKTGIAILVGELEQYRKDLEIASGELMVPIPNLDSADPREINIRRMMHANSLMRRERDRARSAAHDLREAALQHPGGAKGQAAARYIAKVDAIMKTL